MVELKKFYVYELVDPRSDEVFYVGKGQGQRGNQHVMEVRRDHNLEGGKRERIKEIIDSGMEAEVRVVGRFEEESDAFAVEATLITWVYGVDNLTNVQTGHGSTTIRKKGYLGTLEGLDIPWANRADRFYLDAMSQAREEKDIQQLLRYLKEFMEAELSIEFSELDNSDPGITRIWGNLGSVSLRLGANHGGKNPSIVFRLECNEASDKPVFRRICKQAKLEYVGQRKRMATYSDIEGWKDFAELARRLRGLIQIVRAVQVGQG